MDNQLKINVEKMKNTIEVLEQLIVFLTQLDPQSVNTHTTEMTLNLIKKINNISTII